MRREQTKQKSSSKLYFGCPYDIYGVYQDFLLDHYSGKEWSALQIEPLSRKHYDEWAALKLMSRETLEEYEPLWDDNELSPQSFEQRISSNTTYPKWDYAVSVKNPFGQRLFVGSICVQLPRGGTEKTFRISYWVGEPFQGLGIGSEAMQKFVHMFVQAGQYRRIEALVCPENMPSQKILEKNQFVSEGLLRKCLKIKGLWRDHIFYAFLNEDVDSSEETVQY
jgi:[ribosomal protein S5]-alanine N-acetyltransferase